MNPFDFTQFETLLLSIDPNASKYEGNGNEAYTVWTPCGEVQVRFSNNRRSAVIRKVQIDRFTKSDSDTVAAKLYATLDAVPWVTFEYVQDFEPDTGYIHHIYDCEVF